MSSFFKIDPAVVFSKDFGCAYRCTGTVKNWGMRAVFRASAVAGNQSVIVKTNAIALKVSGTSFGVDEEATRLHCINLADEGAFLVRLSPYTYFPKLIEEEILSPLRRALVMEDCGETLNSIIEKRKESKKPFSSGELKPLIRDVLEGLNILQRANICHGDIKPENIVVREGRIKIIDFGNALQVGKKVCGFPFQTTWYRSPEMALELSNWFGCAVDMWSFGCVLFEMISGYPLFPLIGVESPLMTKDHFSLIWQISGPLPQEWIVQSPYLGWFIHTGERYVILGRMGMQATSLYQIRQPILHLGSFVDLFGAFATGIDSVSLKGIAEIIKKCLVYNNRLKPSEAILLLSKLP